VRLNTGIGNIVIAVDAQRADHRGQLLEVCRQRLLRPRPVPSCDASGELHPQPSQPAALEVIQAGINPSRKSKAFPLIPLERTSITGLKHVVGTVSMARGAADSATSDFFILLNDQPSLDFGETIR
jgi:hypothetical protein